MPKGYKFLESLGTMKKRVIGLIAPPTASTIKWFSCPQGLIGDTAFVSGLRLAPLDKMSEEKKEIPHYKADRETIELYKEMKKIGVQKFREMWGQGMLDQFKELMAEERRLFPIKNKILLQGKLKYDYPMCEKCVHWGGASAGSTRCPYDDLEKNILFEKNEISQNQFPIELCEKFAWKKDE
jgi:hypothetical protein